MTAPNHILGGLVITGLFGSFLNLNILSNPLYIAATIFGSIIPDIDYTKSLIGRFFRPISKQLNQRFGHRTVTHSLAVLFVSNLLSGVIENTLLHQSTISKIYFLGFFSHLVLDMMTVQGVPLFYPFFRNPCVLPGNPNARFKTGHFQSETLIFCFFLLSFVFLQPLFENGFWTQYNRYFGTPKHIASEFHKSNKALKVNYQIKRGTELLSGEGICLSANESKIVLLEKRGFHHLDKEQYTILEVIPEQTDSALHFKTIRFFNITLDSLNNLLQLHHIKQLELFANQPFHYLHQGFLHSAQTLNLDYPEQLNFQQIPYTTTISPTPFYPNPKILTIQLQIENEIKLQEEKRNAIIKHKTKLSNLRNLFNTLDSPLGNSKSPTEKQKLYTQIKALEKIKLPKPDFTKVENLKMQLNELKRRDSINYEKTTKSPANTIQKHEPIRCSGNITYILLKRI